ncbi:MAG: bifunctional chorismate mutase/prephenate dehydratase [Gemmatimonadota bacterium]|nr:bifunctional chorismate mutase/prephenate dehydratase [Gemmatimonadota bacterium]
MLWGDAAEPVPMRTFEDVMDAAECGRVDYGMLPIESTLVGGLNDAYDLLALHDGLLVVAEVVVPIRLCVLALPGARMSTLRSLASHPVMLAQCSHFFDRHKDITPEPAWDTAGAARIVMERGDRTRAAAGSRRAAERFELLVLADRIEDRPDTQMRFLAVSPEPAAVAIGASARTAVLCTVREGAGALVATLQPLATHGFSMSHFATRPTREPWQYQYYVEFEHEAGDVRASQALDAMRSASASFRVLGTYARWQTS